MRKYECRRCEREFNNYESLRKHTSRIHKIKSEDFYVEFKLKGNKPTCKCGCGEETNWNRYGEGFNNYIKGHHNRVHNNWGHNKKAIKKSAETRRKQFKNGDRKVWNDGLTKETSDIIAKISEMSKKENNPERAKKISKALKGVPKSEEHNKKNTEHWQKYWANPKHREEQRERRVKYMNKFLVKKITMPEKNMKKILKNNNIDFEFQYVVGGYNYDFYLPKYNILIETDGDWWHCNPEKYEPIYESQKHTIEHDKVKNKIAKDNNIPLIRIWESEINDDIAKVTKRILDMIYKK